MSIQKTNLPNAFIERMANQISDVDAFVESLELESPTFVRLNYRKLETFTSSIEGEVVPWNSDALRLKERPKFNIDPLYQAGLYYPMEGSSMFLKHVLKYVPLEEDGLILDLCAAPGGKTLILKDFFPDNFLVSNEIETKRAHILKENVIRWGTDEHLVINSEAKRLARSSCKFDLILVDAPCSGEGLFRKDEKSRNEWTLERAAGCAARQTTILEDVQGLFREGGYLIYSTCTYNPEENIEQIKTLVGSGDFESIQIPVPEEWRIEEIVDNQCYGYQFYTHKIQGEGFFIALLRYTREQSVSGRDRLPKWKPQEINLPEGIDLGDKLILELNGHLFAFTEREWKYYHLLKPWGNIVKKGLYLGEFKGKDFIPSHDVSMHSSVVLNFPRVELSIEQALYYLKGNAIQVQCDKGVLLLTYDGVSIGFGKSNGSRINNLIPKHLRI